MTFAILYERPDGWWLAGDEFVDLVDAIDAGDEHEWYGSDWKVVPSSEIRENLCAEALEEFHEQNEEE